MGSSGVNRHPTAALAMGLSSKVRANPATTGAAAMAVASFASVDVGPPCLGTGHAHPVGLREEDVEGDGRGARAVEGPTSRPITSRGQGHWPCAARLASSTATMTTCGDGAGGAVRRTAPS